MLTPNRSVSNLILAVKQPEQESSTTLQAKCSSQQRLTIAESALHRHFPLGVEHAAAVGNDILAIVRRASLTGEEERAGFPHRWKATLTWVTRLRKLCPITHVSQELVRFDTQALQRPEITGIEYQQGTLAGYELREYLLEKWERRCAYCRITSVPLQIEHIIPKARGGTDRASNLTLACESCNCRKNTQTAAEFGHPEVQARGQQPLKDTAAVNTIRWALYERLQAIGLPVETSTGGHTKYNRILQGLPKSHWLDAICVGKSTPSTLQVKQVRVLLIWSVGHGKRQNCRHQLPLLCRSTSSRRLPLSTLRHLSW